MLPTEVIRPVPFATMQRPKGLGRVYYVNTYGANVDDSGSGLDPNQPLQKVQTAIDKCVAGHNDYVIVQDVWDADTEPILANKHTAHIIGLAHAPLPSFATVAVTGDHPAFQIGAHNHIEIAGFCLGGGPNHGGIEAGWAANSPMGLWIHHNWFGTVHPGAVTPIYGIMSEAPGGPTYSVFEDNTFFGDGMPSGIGLIDGIAMLMVGCTGSMIRRNRFIEITAVNLHVSNAIGVMIYDNRFAMSADTIGLAITLVLCGGCHIDGNEVSYAKTVNVTVQFADDSDAGINHWGNNTQGGTAKFPAQV